MKRNVWIMNHYAGKQFFDNGGRHFSFANHLKEKGYSPVIFCSNSSHWTSGFFYNTQKLAHVHRNKEIRVPFVFVRSREYEGNGKQRILNMLDFYVNVKRAAIIYAKKHGKPDIIIASSVHPLTLIAGIQLARHFKVKCITEVRDLWPESIVAYSDKLTKKNIIIRLLYEGEKWIYRKSDHIIMTWPGGYDYIKEKRWNKQLPIRKFTYISNGVELDVFKRNSKKYTVADGDLEDQKHLKFVYCGAVRKVNNVQMIADAARLLIDKGNLNALILIYGDGEEYVKISEYIREYKLDNIIMKGSVEKSYIPYILSKSDVSILHNSSTYLDRFGQSQNKFFEYLAAGKPILMTYSVGYSVVRNQHCGIEIEQQSAEAIANAIQMFCEMPKDVLEKYGLNTKKCSEKYDYKVIVNELVTLIEEV